VCPHTPSDHYYVSFTVKNAAPSVRETAVTWRRDLESINRFHLLSSLKDSGLLCPFLHKSSKPDELVSSIYTDLRKAVDAVAPSRPQRPNARDHSLLLSRKLEQLRRAKRKIERRFRKTRSPDVARVLKTFLNKYDSTLRKSKSTLFFKKLCSNTSDHKKVYKTVNYLLNRSNECLILVALMCPNFSHLFLLKKLKNPSKH